jgi:hypothetical protein
VHYALLTGYSGKLTVPVYFLDALTYVTGGSQNFQITEDVAYVKEFQILGACLQITQWP